MQEMFQTGDHSIAASSRSTFSQPHSSTRRSQVIISSLTVAMARRLIDIIPHPLLQPGGEGLDGSILTTRAPDVEIEHRRPISR